MNKKFITPLTLAILMAIPLMAAAAIDPLTWFSEVLDRFLRIVVWPVFVGIVIIMIIWAGFLFVTGQGDPTKIAGGKKTVLWAIIGVIVVILAFSAIGLITRILNLNP